MIIPRQVIKSKGFTLIELMIVVAIIGILAAISYPSYTSHITKTYRKSGQVDLMAAAQAAERFYTQNFTYVGFSLGTAATDEYVNWSPTDGNVASKHYTLNVVTAAANSFTLRAVPAGAQVGDGAMEIDADGSRRWDADDDADAASGQTYWGN
jgi:type IV pilus assembly protein PilE